MRRALLALAVLAIALAPGAGAQTTPDDLARGIRAYQNLDYDSAAALLRAALEPARRPALSDADRIRALVYLGSTELFREHRDSAAAAFGRVLLLDPRYRPDQLVFPPEVSGLFQEVRLATRVVAVSVALVTQIAAPADRLVAWLYAASDHQVEAAVLRANGVPLRSLYSGGVGDSLQVLWDGRGDGGVPVEAGSYVLRVDSRGSTGRVVRSLEVPLDVAALRGDTLTLPPPPADSLFLPEHTAPGGGWNALATGLAAAVTVVVLPSLVAGGSSGMGERFAVAGALGVAGVAGFQLQHRPRPIPRNIAANQVLRLRWQRQADSVRVRNAARRQDARLVIRAGPARLVDTP